MVNLLSGLVLMALCAYARLPRAPGRVRSFWSTPDGQLHYVTSHGSKLVTPAPVVMLHGNPRSVDEFTEIFNFFDQEGWPYLAVDIFGQGCSDVAARTNFTLFDYAAYVLQIVEHEFGRECSFTPMASLTGCGAALPLALTVGSNRVKKLVLHAPFYYYPEVAQAVQQYIDSNKNWHPEANGSHLLDAWNQISFQPSAPSTHIGLTERKTLDRLIAATTEWMVMQAYIDYNPQIISQLQAVAADLLVFWGTTMVDIFNAAGMRAMDSMNYTCAVVGNKAVGCPNLIEGGSEALVAENSTAVWSMLRPFLLK